MIRAASTSRDEVINRQTQGVAAGRRDAFADFYCAHFDRMYRQARHATGRDESFCLDVVQDAMLRVIRSLRVPFGSERALHAWLRRVVVSCAIDRLRAEQRGLRERKPSVTQGVQALADQLAHGQGAHPDTATSMPTEERLAWLRAELSQLPDAQSKLIVMRYRFGWTLERIGRAVGLSPSAVDGRIRRTITRLQKNAVEEFHD